MYAFSGDPAMNTVAVPKRSDSLPLLPNRSAEQDRGDSHGAGRPVRRSAALSVGSTLISDRVQRTYSPTIGPCFRHGLPAAATGAAPSSKDRTNVGKPAGSAVAGKYAC